MSLPARQIVVWGTRNPSDPNTPTQPIDKATEYFVAAAMAADTYSTDAGVGETQGAPIDTFGYNCVELFARSTAVAGTTPTMDISLETSAEGFTGTNHPWTAITGAALTQITAANQVRNGLVLAAPAGLSATGVAFNVNTYFDRFVRVKFDRGADSDEVITFWCVLTLRNV